MEKISDRELLNYALDNGIIDLALLQEKIEMQKREELLKKHSYSIYQGSNDKMWYTYLPDSDSKRKKIKASTKKKNRGQGCCVLENARRKFNYRGSFLNGLIAN